MLARHTFDARHVGAPGVAHGGAVAAVLDDLGGFVLYIVGQLGVTRNLSVDYYAPVRLHVPYRLSSWLNRREGRKLFLRMEGYDPIGQLAFSADAVFLVVSTEHFIRANDGNPVAQSPCAPAPEPRPPDR